MSSAQRRINSTGRRKINKNHIDIVMLTPAANEPLAATATITTDEWKFPGDARIVLEAYHRNSGMRFDCGTVAKPSVPDVLKLDELDPSSNVLFRLKVIDGENGSGKMLGAAERIRPGESDNAEGRRSLFPIVCRYMEDELVKVDISDAGATLILNSRVPGFTVRILEDPMLAGTLLPQAFREVITHVVNQLVSEGDDEGAWEADWIEFCMNELGMDDPTEMTDEEERTEWIDNVVAGFCRKNDFLAKTRKALQEVN